MLKDEADNYLDSALRAWNQFADRIVVLNDNSTDNTADLCREHDAFVVDWSGPKAWGNETPARKALWDAAVQSGCDFIMVLDGDMVPARNPKDLLVGGIDAVAFYLYDLWAEDAYRFDHFWCAHTVPRLWIARNPGRTGGFHFSGRKLHSGHFPTGLKLERIVTAPREYSILHYAYVTEKDRQKKKKQYLSQGHLLTTHEWLHACSIDDPEPRLLPLDVDVSWPLRKSSSAPVSDKTP